MPLITYPVDRAVPSAERFQHYDNADESSLELTFDFKKDLGKSARTGYIRNNDQANSITLEINYASDIDSSLKPIVLTAADKFIFSPLEFCISSLRITAANAISVDIFVA